MLYISPTLTGYILLLLSPITVITYYNGRRVKKLSRTIKDNLAQMLKKRWEISELLSGSIKYDYQDICQIQERREYLDYKAKNKLLFDNDNKRARIRAAFGAGVGLSMKVSN